MYFDDEKCAQCGKALPSYHCLEEYNKGRYSPHFCSEKCYEEIGEVKAAELIEEPPPQPDFDGFRFEDGEEVYLHSERGQALIKVWQQPFIERERDRVESALKKREWNRKYYLLCYASKREDFDRQKVLDSQAAWSANYYKQLREEEAKELVRQEKEEQRRVKDEEREAQRLEREEERQRIVDEKEWAKEEERLRLEAIETERLRPIPFVIPSDHQRFESVHILGPQGSGKTTLIQAFKLHDLARKDSPGMIVIDPKGLLIERLKALRLCDHKRLVVLDATHPHPPKLGLFVKSSNPLINIEQTVNQAVSTYRYIFESSDFAFTPKQKIMFEYLVRFMFAIGGTLSTLIDFLRIEWKKPKDRDLALIAKYAPMIAALPDDMREFFQIDLKESYESTAKEINVRLQQIKQKPMLRAMFDTDERRIDLFECMQQKKIVLVNTGMAMDNVTSQMVGRFIIAMVINATYVRAAMPDMPMPPTFVSIDEFQQFIDSEKTPEMLRLTREYQVGWLLAHHNMYADEISQGVRVALSTLTGVKFCADPRGQDLNYMAADFNTDADFLRMQQVSATHVHFAHVARRQYHTAVSVSVPRGNLDGLPKRTTEELEAFDRANTKAVNGHITPPKVVYISWSDWADFHNSELIDDDGHCLSPPINVVFKIAAAPEASPEPEQKPQTPAPPEKLDDADDFA